MTISLLAFACLTLTGCGLYRAVRRPLHWVTNPCLEIGTGFFIGMGLVVLWLSIGLLPLTTGSQSLFALGVLFSLVALRTTSLSAVPKWLITGPRRLTVSWHHGLICLIGLYLLFVLINNLHRDIFPWDAFTTWMHRAKAWVVSDHIFDFHPLLPWLADGASGYPLAAAHYPPSVSVVAAFGPALTGTWDASLASIPWFFAMAACALTMVGLCRVQMPHHPGAALAGGAMLVTMPLVHIHGMLAGYADIWVMGTSGMGLAAVCVSTQRRETGALYVGLLLLLLGCLWKSEGWLWLGLGVGVATLNALWVRYRLRALPWLFAALAALWLLQPLSLGSGGVWGFSAEAINLGTFGSFAIRPYNPLRNYLEMTLWQGNFSLIVPMYIAALLLLAARGRDGLSGYLLMAVGISVTHGIIFGVSDYSKYAESGTAINRLLLQMLPVLVVTVTALVRSESPLEHRLGAAPGRPTRSSIYGVALALMAIALALPITIAFQTASHESIRIPDRLIVNDPADFLPVIGQLTDRTSGRQFVESDVAIGVAAVPMKEPGTIQPRYVLSESRMAVLDSIAFYWINSASADVHSVSLPISGSSIIDMAEYETFWQQPIREMGYLVRPQYFQSTTLGTLTLSSSLYDGLPHLKNHWLTPPPLGQRLINTTVGHTTAPISLQGVLSIAFVLICLLTLLWHGLSSKFSPAQPPSLAAGIAALWLMGSLSHLNHSIDMTRALFFPSSSEVAGINEDNAELEELAGTVTQSVTPNDGAVLSVGIDAAGRLAAHRFPFMVLPARAAAVNEGQLTGTADAQLSYVVIFGSDNEQLSAAASRLERSIGLQPIRRGSGYLMLALQGG